MRKFLQFLYNIIICLFFLQELSSREDELRQIKEAQDVHAESLKKREEELAQREMLLLGREISMLIYV